MEISTLLNMCLGFVFVQSDMHMDSRADAELLRNYPQLKLHHCCSDKYAC